MRPDLGIPRGAGDVLGTSFSLFWRQRGVFFALTLLVVAPVSILVDGVWNRELQDGWDAEPPLAGGATSGLLWAFVVPPLVTALHVRVVQALAAGEPVTLGSALRRAAPAFGPAALVVVLYSAGVLVGLVALIVPGVYLAIRWYVGAQVAVVEGRRGRDALRRAGEMTRGLWGHTFVVVLLLGVVGWVAGGVLGLALGGLAALALGDGVGLVVGYTLGSALAYSVTAIGGTLLFFDLLAREAPRTAPATPSDLAAPERPMN